MLTRRRFLQVSSIAGAVGPSATSALAHKAASNGPFVGIQIAPFNLLDEGIDPCLDRVSELAAVNALLIYSHTYYGIPYTRTAEVLADDHGVRRRNDKDRNFWPVWLRHDERFFRDTDLSFTEPNRSTEHFGRDVFAEVLRPARERGIKVYARLLEPGRLDVNGRIDNFDRVTAVDVFGNLANEPCRNHPSYQAWCVAMVTDMFTNYELDGYQWGAERIGPLAGVLSSAAPPGCFCQHCVDRGRREGIDVARAREGYRLLFQTVKAACNGADLPSDGMANHVLGLMLNYPELLAWESLWRRSKEDLARLIYETIKTVKPTAQVGRHIDSKGTTLNPITRAGTNYREMAEYTDFIKPILYQDVMSPRIYDHFIRRWRQGTLREFPEDDVLGFLQGLNGYADGILPNVHELKSSCLPPTYVECETRRLVTLTAGRAQIYPGIGLDVPHREGRKFIRSKQNLHDLKQAVVSCFEAGATGVVASREYDEMRLSTLKAFGDGVRAWLGVK